MRLGAASRVALVLAALIVPAVAGNALSLSSIDARAGLLWLGSARTGQVIAPSPLLNDAGVTLPLSLSRSFSLAPEIDVFGTQYQTAPGGTRSIPTEIEAPSAVWLLSVAVVPAIRYELHFGRRLAWGMEAAPAVVFHIPTVSWGVTSAQVRSITSYFYQEGRFFYPEAGTFFLWQPFASLGLEVRLRAFLPVFHLWDGAGLPFYDQLLVGGSIGLRFRIGGGSR